MTVTLTSAHRLTKRQSSTTNALHTPAASPRTLKQLSQAKRCECVDVRGVKLLNDLVKLYPSVKDLVKITLLEATDHILNMFDKRITILFPGTYIVAFHAIFLPSMVHVYAYSVNLPINCKTRRSFWVVRLRESLLFVITSFGGVVSWEGDGVPFEESNHDIDYQEIDQLSMILSTISDASRLRTSGKILSDMGIVKTKHGYFLLFLAQS
ncbi:hypothetical protein Tco_0900277 [Tanacetum coccineum]